VGALGDNAVRADRDRAAVAGRGEQRPGPRPSPANGVEGVDDRATGGVVRGLDAAGRQRRRDVSRQRHGGTLGRVDVALAVGGREVGWEVDAALPEGRRDGRRGVRRGVGRDERAEEGDRDCHWVRLPPAPT
jgi:hypothetical protein